MMSILKHILQIRFSYHFSYALLSSFVSSNFSFGNFYNFMLSVTSKQPFSIYFRKFSNLNNSHSTAYFIILLQTNSINFFVNAPQWVLDIFYAAHSWAAFSFLQFADGKQIFHIIVWFQIVCFCCLNNTVYDFTGFSSCYCVNHYPVLFVMFYRT